MSVPSPVVAPRRPPLAPLLLGGVATLVVAVLAASALSSGPVAPARARGEIAEASPTAAPAEIVAPSIQVTLPPAAVYSAAPSFAPPASPVPTATPRPMKVPTTRVATRVAVPELGVDLPVMRQPVPYPPCGVAMYILELDQPGSGATGVTYLYAHAQAGLFLPLLTESLTKDGARMLGMTVDVYTGDSLRFTYRITEVRRHQTTMDAAFDWSGPESVWLQTSEGLGSATPKLQVVAELVGRSAATYAESHPEPHPVGC